MTFFSSVVYTKMCALKCEKAENATLYC